MVSRCCEGGDCVRRWITPGISLMGSSILENGDWEIKKKGIGYLGFCEWGGCSFDCVSK